MKTNQINLVSSFRARRAVLSDEMATGARPAFKAALTALDKQLAEIDRLTLAQGQSLPATIAGRDEAIVAMKETALRLAAAASNYAEDKELPAFALQVRLRPVDFDRVRLERRAPIARHLLEALRPAVAQLADYGVTPADLDAFEVEIDAAESAVVSPRNTSVDKKAATVRLHNAVRAASSIFRLRIDLLVRSVRDDYPDFYARYQAARSIVSRPGTHGQSPPAQTAQPATAPVAPPTAQLAAA